MTLDPSLQSPRFDTAPDLDALIEEAWQHTRRRRRRNLTWALIAVLGIAAFVSLSNGGLRGPGKAPARFQPAPAAAAAMPAYHNNGAILFSNYTGLVAFDPATQTKRQLLSFCPDYGPICATSFTWSPDGSHAAYAVRPTWYPYSDPSHPFQAGVWTVDMATRARHTIASCTSDDCPLDISWSPDGRRIAATERGRIELIDPTNGRTATILSLSGATLFDPAWSPGGHRIVFVATRPTGEQLDVINRAGSHLRVLLARPWHRPGVSPTDGTWNVGRIANERTIVSPTWAPNGSTIAVLEMKWPCTSPCTGYDFNTANAGQLVQVVTLGLATHTKHVLFASWHLGGPSIGCACTHWWPPSLTWAPDGTKLAMVTPAGLYLINRHGGKARRISHAFGGQVAWQPVA